MTTMLVVATTLGWIAARITYLAAVRDMTWTYAARRVSVELGVYVPVTVVTTVALLVGVAVVQAVALGGGLLGTVVYGPTAGMTLLVLTLVLLLGAAPPVLYAVAIVTTWPARRLSRRGLIDRLAGPPRHRSGGSAR